MTPAIPYDVGESDEPTHRRERPKPSPSAARGVSLDVLPSSTDRPYVYTAVNFVEESPMPSILNHKKKHKTGKEGRKKMKKRSLKAYPKRLRKKKRTPVC